MLKQTNRKKYTQAKVEKHKINWGQHSSSWQDFWEASRGYSLVVMHGLSLQWLLSGREWALGVQASVAWCMGLVAPWHVGSSCTRTEPVPLALQGGFLTIRTPEKRLQFIIGMNKASKPIRMHLWFPAWRISLWQLAEANEFIPRAALCLSIGSLVRANNGLKSYKWADMGICI